MSISNATRWSESAAVRALNYHFVRSYRRSVQTLWATHDPLALISLAFRGTTSCAESFIESIHDICLSLSHLSSLFVIGEITVPDHHSPRTAICCDMSDLTSKGF